MWHFVRGPSWQVESLLPLPQTRHRFSHFCGLDYVHYLLGAVLELQWNRSPPTDQKAKLHTGSLGQRLTFRCRNCRARPWGGNPQEAGERNQSETSGRPFGHWWKTLDYGFDDTASYDSTTSSIGQQSSGLMISSLLQVLQSILCALQRSYWLINPITTALCPCRHRVQRVHLQHKMCQRDMCIAHHRRHFLHE